MVCLIHVVKQVKYLDRMLSTKINSPTILINQTPAVSPQKSINLVLPHSKSSSMKKTKVSRVAVLKLKLETLYISETLALLKKKKVNKKS